MSLWSDYITELRGGAIKFIEHDWGFVSYEFPAWAQDSILVSDIYIIPAERKSGKGRELFNEVIEVGRRCGKRAVLANLDLTTAIHSESMRAQLAVGLVPIAANSDKILMRRSI